MRRIPERIGYAVLLVLFAGGAVFSSDGKLVRFDGEVSRDHEFRRPIGHGLVFALIPDSSYPGVISGWTLTIAPVMPVEKADCNEFSGVVMPPYRAWNPRYLSTAYSWTAEQAVKTSPRNFNFVLNCGDYQVESSRVKILLWRGDQSDKEYDETLAKLGSSPQGRGKLWIDKSKIGKATREVEGVNFGSIDWIQFHVEIQFP